MDLQEKEEKKEYHLIGVRGTMGKVFPDRGYEEWGILPLLAENFLIPSPPTNFSITSSLKVHAPTK